MYMPDIIVTIETKIRINYIFQGLFGLFPSFYAVIKSQEDLDNCKRQWARSFIEAGIIDSQGGICFDLIDDGLKKCGLLDQSFAPSCGQFIKICCE